ncbi:DUF4157 domain-containing protein [Streptomyces albus]|uniref:eCIS core domain-containing protein n=1 Tax=Streptomyces albus TaxID=1888 RepID=UPI00068C6C25|nr:DUF4157 domain-containing protein [Streptomyces albus]
MSSHASQDSRSDAARNAKRRKRKERSAKNTAPEPKDIVSGAGQPLDLSVRRELEEQLGHDFSRVRLHTDRDAGALTDMLGADAVAVGQDIFFREGTYRPGTAEGQRLLAHELLHTVQNPDGLGALRAGRDLGAVSLPEQAVEREAESAAQAAMGAAARAAADAGTDTGTRTAAGVEPGQATPGWLRYATVDADQKRMELIDPATLTDRVANGLLRSLRGDPADRSKRVRLQLAQMSENLRDAVLDRLERRLLSPEFDRIIELTEETAESGLPERGSLDAPEAVPDAAEELADERERERERAESERENDRRTEPPGEERETADGTPVGRDGETAGPEDGSGTPRPETDPREGTGREPEEPREEQRPDQPEQPRPEPWNPRPAPAGGGGARSGGGTAGPSAGGGTSGGGSRAPSAAASSSAQARPSSGAGSSTTAEGDGGQPGLSGARAASEEESAAKNRPGAVEPLVAGQQVPQRDKKEQDSREPGGTESAEAAKAEQQPENLSRLDGMRFQDRAGGQEPGAEEEPARAPDAAETADPGPLEDPDSAWNTELKPEDFLPATDLDVSGVPTAEDIVPGQTGTPSVPSFPAPPPTRADEIQKRREEEDAAEAEAEERAATPVTEGTEDAAADGADSRGRGAGSGLPGGPGGFSAAVTAPSRDRESERSGGVEPLAVRTAAETEGEDEAARTAGEQQEKDAAGAGAAGAGRDSAEEPADSAGDSETAGSPNAAGAQTGPQSAAGAASTPPPPAPAVDTSDASRQNGGAPTPDRSPGPRPGGTPEPSPGASPDRDAPGTGGSGGTGGTDATGGGGTDGGGASAAPVRQESPARTPAAPARSGSAPSSGGRAGRTRGGGGGTRSAGGGGGGGGGGARPAGGGAGPQREAAAPNLSGVSPEAGLATAAKLKPHRALEALGGVGQAVDKTVGDEHKTLQSAPPTMERPAGAPQTLRGKPATSAPGQYSGDPAAKVDAPEEKKAKVEGDKTPEGEIPGADIPEPSPVDLGLAGLAKVGAGIVNWGAKQLGADEDVIDTDALVGKIMGMPTEDEMLKNATVGTPDGVDLQGETDGRAGEQDGELDSKGRQLHSSGREDSERPLGEDQIYPDVPQETLTAKVPGGKGGGGGGTGPKASTGAIPPEAVSAVAEHERGPQLQSAFADGRQDISAKRRTKDEDFRSSRDDHRRKVRTEIDTNSRTQADERRKTKAEVADSRARWREEQDGELEGLGTKKSAKLTKIRQDVKDKEEKTDKDVGDRQENDEKEIGKKQEKAEDDAKKKRDDAKNDSGNWITKAFDWIREQFVKLRDAIVGFFRAARDAVRNLIKDFKGTVLRWIEEARKWIVEKFREFVDALLELGKALLNALIELANRIRDLIIRIRDAAIALVNELARKLRQMVTDLLNMLGRLLNGILEALRKGLEMAVKAVMTAVKGIMDFALGLLNALGEWAMIAADIITDPGGWLSNAKASAEDGAKNHLFREVTSAIKEWFNAKIQEILGLPMEIFQALINGGITVQQMVKEAWEEALPQLPIIIGEIVVTKVIAKLIPGAGWVLAIIDALKAAWGALSEILNALGAFMNFLKAVKGGGAGLLFAKAVASGVVALLELAYEFLLSGIGKYVSKVGDKFKGMAADMKKGPKGEKPGGKDQTGPKDQDRPKAPTTTAAPRPTGADRPPGPGRDRPTGTDPGRPGGTSRPGTGTTPGRPTRPRPTTDRPARPGGPPRAPQRPTTPNRPARPTADRPATPGRPSRPDDRRPDTTRPDSRRPDDRNRDGARDRDRGRDTPRRPDDRTQGPRRPDRDRDRTPDRDRPRRPSPDRRDRDDHDRRQEERQKQRDDRRKKENSRESKEERLRRIVARIRPVLRRLLAVGVFRPVMQATLSGMRLWYRLTDLFMSGFERGTILARLNPTTGVTGYEEDEQDPDGPRNAEEQRREQQADEELGRAAEERQRRRESEGAQRGEAGQQGHEENRPASPGALSPQLAEILRKAPLPTSSHSQEGESLAWQDVKKSKEDESRLTADHIPSGAALIQAAKNKATAEAAANDAELRQLLKLKEEGRLSSRQRKILRDKEKAIHEEQKLLKSPENANKRDVKAQEVYDEALTLLVTQELHKEGRTFFKKNTRRQIQEDAQDLTTAVEKDFKYYLEYLDGPVNQLTRTQITAFIRHYKNLTDKKVINYSRAIERMLLTYYHKAER